MENLIPVILYSLCMVPLAFLLGKNTENISDYIGEKQGGLLSATLGNLPELIMGLWSLKYGMIAMVKASIIGSILCNMLLGVGIAVIWGGVKYGEQNFNRNIARTNFQMLVLSLSAMIVLAALDVYKNLSFDVSNSICLEISVVLMIIYVLGLIFSLVTHKRIFESSEEVKSKKNKDKKFIYILISLFVLVISLNFIAEKLIFNLQIFSHYYGISEEFLGIVLIPLLGNMGEMASAIISAANNKINLSIETSIGSCIQMCMFVLPIMIIASSFMGVSMDMIYSGFEVIMTVIAVIMSYIVFQDGKTYWFEGAILLSIYTIITLAYYYVA
ncbi:MAG: calcium/proton exchanger [Clostridium sp.]